jgi:hypothetical protein
MPANIAHMVIAHNALTLLKAKGFRELADFAAMLDDPTQGAFFQAYMNLGSVGPDLYYYASMIQSGKEMLLEGFVGAAAVTPWSYHLHSRRPNEFPLQLSEILFRDAVWEDGQIVLDTDDRRKLAYITGHLSHIAADQIIHPLVNRIAKPYYRSGVNRKKHRQCEVFQDYFLYEEVYRGKLEQVEGKEKSRYSFFDQDFRTWVDCIPGFTTRNTEDWFRYFLQRGFAETYGPFPSESDIENSVDNLLLILRICKIRGPYQEADAEYQQYGPNGPLYQEYIAEFNYPSYYKEAVCLSAIYIAALYEVYTTLAAGADFDESQKARFREIVSDADLSCPLEQNILPKARAELTSGPDGQRYEALFEPVAVSAA